MAQEIENVDAWVVARLGALERANRRLWIGVGALFTTLVSLGIAGGLFAAHFEIPGAPASGGVTEQLTVGDLEVRNAIRVVDDAGRNLAWVGREAQSGGATQAVVGLYAAAPGAGDSQQTIRIATSSLGSALSLASADGANSSSLFAGKTGVSLELRRGNSATTYTDKAGAPSSAAAQEAAPPPPAPVPESAPAAEAPAGRRTEADALAGRWTSDVGTFTVDLTNPTLQSLGSGFLVGPTSVTDSSGGLRVRGRIVNTTSVDQSRAEFKLGVGKREVSFLVARVSAGGSAPFAVELPENSKADVRAARMRWLRSTVRYGEE